MPDLTPEEWLEQYLDTSEGYPPFEGRVDDAIFSTDARFQNGQQMLLIWKMTVTEGDKAGEQREQFWGVGKIGSGWNSPDGGKTLVNREGKKIHKSSGYGRGVIAKALGQFGLGPAISAAGGPLNAATWKGSVWVIGDEQVDYGGDIGNRTVKTVLEYKGGLGGAPAPSGVLGEVPAPTATDQFNAVLGALTQTERAFLEEQARTGGNLSDWALTNMPGKMADATFRAAIIDPKFKDALLEVV